MYRDRKCRKYRQKWPIGCLLHRVSWLMTGFCLTTQIYHWLTILMLFACFTTNLSPVTSNYWWIITLNNSFSFKLRQISSRWIIALSGRHRSLWWIYEFSIIFFCPALRRQCWIFCFYSKQQLTRWNSGLSCVVCFAWFCCACKLVTVCHFFFFCWLLRYLLMSFQFVVLCQALFVPVNVFAMATVSAFLIASLTWCMSRVLMMEETSVDGKIDCGLWYHHLHHGERMMMMDDTFGLWKAEEEFWAAFR